MNFFVIIFRILVYIIVAGFCFSFTIAAIKLASIGNELIMKADGIGILYFVGSGILVGLSAIIGLKFNDFRKKIQEEKGST